jgi:hypothetical protein
VSTSASCFWNLAWQRTFNASDRLRLHSRIALNRRTWRSTTRWPLDLGFWENDRQLGNNYFVTDGPGKSATLRRLVLNCCQQIKTLIQLQFGASEGISAGRRTWELAEYYPSAAHNGSMVYCLIHAGRSGRVNGPIHSREAQKHPQGARNPFAQRNLPITSML